MTDLTQAIHELLGKQLRQNDFDLVGVTAIPAQGDKMVRLRTIEESLEDFESSSNDVVGYLIQVKPKRQPEPATPAKPSLEGMYLPNGKLNVPFLIRNAELLFEAGEYPLARNIYRSVLQSGERTGTAYLGMARCFEAENRLEDARASYEESIAYHPSMEAYRGLSSLLVQQKKDQSAAEVMERALNLKDLSAATRFELHKACGNCYTRAQKHEEAERHFLEALKSNPSADEIRANLGALCLQGGKISEAKRHFQDAVASNPRNDKALSGLGSCHLAEGEKRLAHDFFAQALEIELNNPTAIFYLVKCAYEIKSYANAARILESYIQISPVNTNLLYSLAGLQYHLGRIQEARSTTLKILQLQPEHAGARDLLNLIERYVASSPA